MPVSSQHPCIISDFLRFYEISFKKHYFKFSNFHSYLLFFAPNLLEIRHISLYYFILNLQNLFVYTFSTTNWPIDRIYTSSRESCCNSICKIFLINFEICKINLNMNGIYIQKLNLDCFFFLQYFTLILRRSFLIIRTKIRFQPVLWRFYIYLCMNFR